MAFVPEDGSGLSTANGYVAVVFVDAHHTERGNAGWTGIDSLKEQAIVRATDYIDQRFGQKFRGFRRTKGQALEWPRLDAFDDDDFAYSSVDVIPRQLQKACAEYALRAMDIIQLAPDPQLPFSTRDVTAEGSTQLSSAEVGEVGRKKKKVGPIEVETEYRAVSRQLAHSSQLTSKGTPQVPALYIPAYPTADLWIGELLRSSTSKQLFRG